MMSTGCRHHTDTLSRPSSPVLIPLIGTAESPEGPSLDSARPLRHVVDDVDLVGEVVPDSDRQPC